ncbi:hypothetical protein H5410_036240 [Solanum commersonii]|uniref:Uncharacterized protein n=1 Tax=Solanum commersonii TaxID=4109 RepID=A0A9J5Y5X6_SOLCO|nr:hypothetical protein H5410_036240 [Solanum commersonii]
MHDFTHRFALIFQSTFASAHSRSKSIFMLCNFRRYGTASWNHSATRRLLLSIAYLIFSFKAWHTGILGEIKAIRRFTQWFRRSSGLLFFILSAALFLFAQ